MPSPDLRRGDDHEEAIKARNPVFRRIAGLYPSSTLILDLLARIS
jgi:hypothetical protein